MCTDAEMMQRCGKAGRAWSSAWSALVGTLASRRLDSPGAHRSERRFSAGVGAGGGGAAGGLRIANTPSIHAII